MASASNRPTRKRTYRTAEVITKLDESDSELYDDSDSDRDSNYMLSDVEPVSDADSSATEVNAQPPVDSQVAMSVDDTVDTDPPSDSDDSADVTRAEWIPVSETYIPPTDILFTGNSGIVQPTDLSAASTPIELFQQFITDSVIDTFVSETNRFAEQFLHATTLKRKSRAHNWSPTNSTEMKKFLGLLLTMGMVKKSLIADYWSTDPIVATPVFNASMPRDRFELLLKFWHFSDNQAMPEGDRLFKLRGVCNAIIERFQTVYIPGRELSIDESMVLWRGRLMFRQYIPGKRHKYGVKLYMLCEPSGYVWNAHVYSGKSDPISGLGHSESVVMQLMEKRLDYGHVVYVDNFYTGVPLAKALLAKKTLLCGTLRRNRKHLPEAVVSAKLKTGECVSRRNGRIVVSKWRDKREVMMLSTLHTGKMTDSGKVNRRRERVNKPDSVIDYNMHMCGVDRMDQLVSYYTPLRKTLKWYRKVVLHHIDLSLVNAYILYKKLGGTQRQIWFRKQVIRSLLAADDRPADMSQETTSSFVHHKASDLSRLSGQHYFDIIPATGSKALPTKKCVVCRKRGQRKETRYFCQTCSSKPALCVVPCFKDFHSSADF